MIRKLEQLLATQDAFLVEGRLNKNKVAEMARKDDTDLLDLLLSDTVIKKHFFVETSSKALIFKKDVFLQFINTKEFLPDSFTTFKSKIGLGYSEGRLLEEKKDVVLNWPYKDCILEGGQNKEDAKRKEMFFNETLAPTEIDRLLDDKVFENFKRYDTEGEHIATELKDDDNLIIKGNNLIALHSLEKRYAGKVKLIYVDPPYNTGSDSFQYNDSFNRSAWLTFIKNRFEIARKLLTDDGVFLTQISFHEYPYLRVALDSILGADNHQFDMNILVRHPERTLTGDKPFNDVVEYTLIYAKTSTFKMPRIEKVKTADKYVYNVSLKEPNGLLEFDGKQIEVFLPERFEISKSEVGKSNLLHRETIRGSIREKNSSGRFYVKHIENLRNEYPEGTIFKVPNMGDDSLNFRLFELPINGNKNGAYFQGMPLSSTVTKKPYPNYMDFVNEFNSANKEGVYEFRNGKKPEALIQKYMEIFANENDLVLDFFMGSGTTQATALKMNRRFIGIEQMDYINEVSVPRLQKVIAGEQDGISKNVNWQGGGSFVYCELKNDAQDFKNKIRRAEESAELLQLLKEAKNSSFLSYRVDPKRLNDGAFNQLSIGEQKQILEELVDLNNLYVNYSEINDTQWKVDENTKKLNRQFYGEDV